MMTKSRRLLVKLLALQIVAVQCLHVPLSSMEPASASHPRLLDYKTSKSLKKLLNSVKSKLGWIYNATIPHGYGDAVASYDVPIYNKFGADGKPTLAGYTKDYIVEPDDSKDELKTIEAAELSLFEKFERFKNNVDLLFMTKVILKILVFKKIIKFIALVCLLFFLPTINDESSRNLKHRGNSTIWDDNFDYRSKEILYFASQAIDYATVDKMVWCVAEHDAFCRFESMMDGIDQIYTIDNIVRWWYPQSKPRLLKLLDSVADWKNNFFAKFGDRFHVTQLTFRDDNEDGDASGLENAKEGNTLDDVDFESMRDGDD